jgi:hypothetical protein
VTDCATLVATGWDDHAHKAAEVAERLAASLPLIVNGDDALAYARLAVHVYGEHLGRWHDGIALLETIAALPMGGADAAAPLRRHIAMLRFASGDAAALAGLGHDDRVAVLASAAAALAGRQAFKRALAVYADALALAGAGLSAGSPAVRALAVGGNNLAAALEEHGARDADETRGMVDAAEAGLRWWKQAGTWLEEERAECRLAKSLLQAGRAAEALASARRAVAVCERNDAPAFERFFTWAAVSAAERAAGNAAGADDARTQCGRYLDAVAADERAWCEPEWQALQG